MVAENSQVLNTVISVVGGIIIAYITNVVSKKVQERREAKEPKDRVELLFERYDAALKQKDTENEELRGLLRAAEAKLHEANVKLNKADIENSTLKADLEQMKRQYRSHRGDAPKSGSV